MQPNQTSQAPYNYLDWVLESRDRGKQKKNENHSSQSLDCSSKMPTRSKGPHIWKIFGLIFRKYLGSGNHVDHTSDTIRAASSLLIDCPTWPIESCCYSDIHGEKQTESDWGPPIWGPRGSSPPYLNNWMERIFSIPEIPFLMFPKSRASDGF